MFAESIKQIKIAFIFLSLFTLLTGLIYPAAVTVIAQVAFPKQANGSLIEKNNHVIGSELIGQSFTSSNYFWSRPSATTPFPYNAENSSGSNLGPSNPDLVTQFKERVKMLQSSDPDHHHFIPVDLVTTSASGLDPDISPAAAYFQAARIAKVRKISQEKILALIASHISHGEKFWGEARVNVLLLNLALDDLQSKKGQD